MGDDKITITYETLFEMLRNEKNREDLQKLSDDFLLDVKGYISEKKDMLKSSQSKLEIFSDDERTKAGIQINNIKKILRELYDKRERKIITLAINKSRTNTNIIDTSSLLEHEKKLFDELTKLFSEYRFDILQKLFEEKQAEKEEVNQDEEEEDDEQEEKKEVKTKVVRFLTPVPKFMGKELEVHGPFDEEDVASLPVDIVDLLIKKGRAEELSD